LPGWTLGRPAGPTRPLLKEQMKESGNYWLVKQEPETYSWEDLKRDGRTAWTGVRNYQARNNLREMKAGDLVLFYHSGKAKAVVGIAQVAKGPYAEITPDKGEWTAIDIKPVKALPRPVTLAAIRANARLGEVPLIRHTRLSVMPLKKKEFEAIVEMAG
jgi:predicted RNA-binding protein with PUA-like domain